VPFRGSPPLVGQAHSHLAFVVGISASTDVAQSSLHGDDHQIVPIADPAQLSSKLVKGAMLKATRAVCTACGPLRTMK